MNYIKTYAQDSPEYKQLEKVAEAMTDNSPTGVDYTVGETYIDFGQDWIWTTILAQKSNGEHWQALSPADLEKILFAKDEEIEQIALDILNGKFSPDKI